MSIKSYRCEVMFMFLIVLQLPDISSCKVQLYDESQALTKEADCSPVGVAPQVTWIHNPTLSKVKVAWEMNHVKPIGMPDKTFAPHVANAPVPLGIRVASFNVSFSQGGGTGGKKWALKSRS